MDCEKVTMKEYVEKRNKVLNKFGRTEGYCTNVHCTECPLHGDANGTGLNCSVLESEFPLKAVKLIMDYDLTPKTDWSKVPVGTKIWVRDSDAEEWKPRYFAEYNASMDRVCAFCNGATSFSAGNGRALWKYAKLYVEGEQ